MMKKLMQDEEAAYNVPSVVLRGSKSNMIIRDWM